MSGAILLGASSAMEARSLAHRSASTSAPAPMRWAPPPRSRRHTPRGGCVGPVRITNTLDELFDDEELARRDEFLSYQEVPVFDPERGSLSARVERALLDQFGSDEISLEETGYWFSTPPEGWEPKEKQRKAKRAPYTEPYPGPHEDYVDERAPLSQLQVGQELVGCISDVWLFHGAQIDFGGEYDGLIPINEEEWPDVSEDLLPGIEVTVRVVAIRQLGLYRWPLQLELVDEALAPLITRPDEWDPPINLEWAFDEGWSMEQILEATGRTYTAAKYYLERDHDHWMRDIQEAYGWDEPDINGHELDEVAREQDDLVDMQVAQVMTEAALGSSS